jgi:hypothetical protein
MGFFSRVSNLTVKYRKKIPDTIIKKTRGEYTPSVDNNWIVNG